MPMDQDKKDFLLHLYDKLWDNIASKEARLWSYLSIYGAAVALAIGAGQYAATVTQNPGVQLYAVLVVLALTLWAVMIVINANWWFQRNRLMVTQIEKQFEPSGALIGVVPPAYRDGKFQIDRLYRASVLILSTIALLFYLRTMWQFHNDSSFSSSDQIISIGLIYALFLISIVYCVNQHDSYIATYYTTKRALLLDEPGANVPQVDALVENGRREARKSYAWTGSAVWVLIFVMVTFDCLPGRDTLSHRCLLLSGLLLQLLAIVFYLILTVLPRGRYRWRDGWYFRLAAALVIFASATAFLITPTTIFMHRVPQPQQANTTK